MRGGPSLKGKEGRVGFRKTLKVPRKHWWVFERPNFFYFFECQESTCRLSKNLLSIKRGFSKAFFKPYFLKKYHIFKL